MATESSSSLPNGTESDQSIFTSTKQDQQPKIRYGPLEKIHIDVIVPFLLQHFYPREPGIVAIGFDGEKDIKPWLPTAIEYRLSMHASVGAWDAETNELIGIAVNEKKIANAPKATMLDKFATPETRSVYEIKKFLETLIKGHNLFEIYNVDVLGHMSMLCVRPDYERRGIAFKLLDLSEKEFLKQNINTLFAEAMSDFAAKAFQRIGYTVLAEMAYADYRRNGEVVFKYINDHKFCRLVAKQLPSVN